MDTIKRVFCNRRGSARLLWLLSLSALLYWLSVYAVPALYWLVYTRMMNVWGVTRANVARAPGIVQALYRFSALIATLIESAMLLLSARLLNGLFHVRPTQTARGFLKGACAGMAGLFVIWVLLLMMGNVRLGWRLTKPVFSLNTAALLVTTAAEALGESCFLYGALRLLLNERLPAWSAALCMAIVGMLDAFLNDAFTPLMLINGALATLVCATLCNAEDIAPAVGFRFSWNYMDRAILGFAGSTAALYETYPVNRYWLNGGNLSINAGAAVTFLYLALLAMQYMRKRGADGGALHMRKWKKERT